MRDLYPVVLSVVCFLLQLIVFRVGRRKLAATTMRALTTMLAFILVQGGLAAVGGCILYGSLSLATSTMLGLACEVVASLAFTVYWCRQSNDIAQRLSY